MKEKQNEALKMSKVKKNEKNYSEEVLFFMGSLLLCSIIFFIGRFFGNIGMFIASLIIFIFIGRQIGNRVSKFLFFQNTIVIILVSLIWGGITALLFRLLFVRTHPGIISIIIGYGAGLYTSIINYDVFMRNPRLYELFPPGKLDENQEIMNFISIISFIALSAIFYFLLK